MATKSSDVFSPPTVDTPVSPDYSAIHRFLSTLFPITWEGALVIGLALLGVLTRLWNLGARVMSHDESLHAIIPGSWPPGRASPIIP